MEGEGEGGGVKGGMGWSLVGVVWGKRERWIGDLEGVDSVR